MQGLPYQSRDKHTPQSSQTRVPLTSNFAHSKTDSFSDIIDYSADESVNDFKNFIAENNQSPKFMQDLQSKAAIVDPSNLDSDEGSDIPGSSLHGLKSIIKHKNSTYLENMKGETKNSLKYSTITFYEASPSIRRFASEYAPESRENSPFALKKVQSEAKSQSPSLVNQSLENNSTVKAGSIGKAASIVIPESSVKKKFVKHVTDHNDDVASVHINIKSSTLGDIDINKVARSSNLIMTRAFIRAAFRKAIEKNKDLDPNKRELDILQDKSYVPKMVTSHERRLQRMNKRPIPKMKTILQNHGILSKDIKRSEIKKILDKIRKTRTFSQEMSRQYRATKLILKRKLRFLKSVAVIFKFRIHPVGYFRLGWDFFSMLLIFYDLIMIPFQMGFNVSIEDFFFYFERMEDVFFFADIMINFLTGFYEDGLLVRSGKQIAKRYLKTWFAIDITSTMTSSLILDNIFPPDPESSSNRGSAFRLLKFLRFIRFMRVLRALRLKRIFNRMEEFVYSNLYLSLKGLFTLLFYVAFAAHLSACLWNFVGTAFIDDDTTTIDSWVVAGGYDQLGMADQYVVCLYWAITTMLTVGYGDIVPVNMLERLINILIMVMGCGVFGYSMNKIGEIVQSFNRGSSQTRQIYYNINKYMEKMNVSKPLRIKVVQYLNYMNENQKHGKLAEEEVFSVLSESLKEEITKDINGKVLRENVLFIKNFEPRFLNLLSYKLEERTYSPGQVIFDEFDKTCSLYLVTKGTIEIFISRCDTVISRLDGESHFGELSFFTGRPRTASARSLTFAHVFFITKQEFLTLIEDHPKEKETYHLIKDQMNLYNNFRVLEVKCIVCGDENHDARECYRIHYVPDRKKILSNYQRDYTKFCETYKRKNRKKFYAVYNQPEVAYLANVFLDRHPDEAKKVSLGDVTRQRLSKQSPFQEENIFAMKAPQRYSKNGIVMNSVIPEESPHEEQTARKGPKVSTNRFSQQLKVNASFATEEEDDNSAKPSPKLGANKQRSILGFMSPDLQLREVFPRRGSSPKNTFSKMGILNIDSQLTPPSALDEQFLRAMEGSYWMSEFQKMDSQFIVFDMVCNYSVYFPQNNVKNILADMTQKGLVIRGLDTEKDSPEKRMSISYGDIKFGKTGNDSSILSKSKGTSAKKTKSEKNLSKFNVNKDLSVGNLKNRRPSIMPASLLKLFEK